MTQRNGRFKYIDPAKRRRRWEDEDYWPRTGKRPAVDRSIAGHYTYTYIESVTCIYLYKTHQNRDYYLFHIPNMCMCSPNDPSIDP